MWPTCMQCFTSDSRILKGNSNSSVSKSRPRISPEWLEICQFLLDASELVEFHFGSLFLSVLVLLGACPLAHDESMMDFLKAVLSS
jgi:hypothetical protein